VQPENSSILITVLLAIPAVAVLAIAILHEKMARGLAIAFSSVLVAVSAFLWIAYSPSLLTAREPFAFAQKIPWISAPVPIEYHVGVDGMSLALVVLTSFVILMAVLASDTVTLRPKLYYSFLMLLTLSILGVFVSLDLLQFFVFYELELVPMYFLIAIWGGPRRDYAAMKFLIYTFLGGVLMLGSILFVYFLLLHDDPATNFSFIQLAARCPKIQQVLQPLAFIGFFLAFIIKLPSVPLHTWLPDAHVEAPTPVSMILAGLLLKMGAYGLVRICAGFFPNVIAEYGPFIMLLGAINIVWGAIACLVQMDMKRIIAYSSVSHMGFVLMGVGAATAAALSGAIFQMISHGVVSAALFFLVGTVYERTHTRQLDEIGGGLAKQMPTLFYFWMLATLANLGLPGLSGFVAETAVYYGSFMSPFAISGAQAELARGSVLFATVGVILTAGYMLWLLKRLFFGEELAKWQGHLTDARPNERVVAWALSIAILGLGVYPLLLTGQYDNVVRKTSIVILQTI
jgi:NADH-quinone oxidoreductase subunit M